MSATSRGSTYDRLGRYYTPELLARAAVRNLPMRSGQVVLEPHVGAGAWARAVEFKAWEKQLDLELHVMDLDDTAPGLSSRVTPSAVTRVLGDFLLDDPGVRPDWIVGNCPYAIDAEEAARRYRSLDVKPDRKKPVPVAELHVRRSLQLVRPGGSVVYALREGFNASQEREDFFKRFPPRHFWTVVPRPPYGGGKRESDTDSCEYAVFWWQLGWTGPTTWSRLRWK